MISPFSRRILECSTMTRSHLKYIAFIAGVGALAAVLFVMSQRDTPELQRVELVRANGGGDASAASTVILGSNPSNVPAVTLPAPTKSTLSSVSLASRYRGSQNLRAFIQDGLKSPEQGGRFYAVLAYTKCRRISGIQVPAISNAFSEKQIRAIDLVKAEVLKCSGVMDQFGSDGVTIARQALDQRTGVDKLMPPNGRGILNPTAPADFTLDIQRAKASGDPYLLAVTLEANVDHLIPTLIRDINRQISAEAFYAAAAAAACDLTSECIGAISTLAPCAIKGECSYDDYRILLRERLPAELRSDFDIAKAKILEIASQ